MNNDYIKRKVAIKDMQSCMICQKPTTTVIHNPSGSDFIYTCDIHLQDNPNFVVPVYSDKYNNSLKELQIIKQQLDIQTSNDSGNWDTWVTKIFTKKSDKSSTDENDQKNDDIKEDPETKTPSVDLKADYSRILDEVTLLQMNNRHYKLSDSIFQHRVQLKRQHDIIIAKKKQEEANYSNTHPEELEAKYNFPTVPDTGFK